MVRASLVMALVGGGCVPADGGETDTDAPITATSCAERGLVYVSDNPICGEVDQVLGHEPACVPACDDTGSDCRNGARYTTCG